MGRSSVFMVIGFSAIFLLVGKNMSDVSVQAIDNSITYYENTQRYNIAVSGANLACSELFRDPTWRTGFTGISFNGGTFSVTAENYGTNQVKIVSSGDYQGITQQVSIIMQPSFFSKFAYFSNNEPAGIYWTYGDTVWGPYHSNTYMYVDQTPVFHGKATTKNGIVKKTSSAKPKFLGGYESGVNLTMPTNMNPLLTAATSGGFVFTTTSDVYLTFNADATVSYKIGAGAWTTTLLTTLSPNGAIVVNGGNLRIKGVLDGRATVAAIKSGGTGGTVYIDDDITYEEDPRQYPSSDDMLGIVGTEDILITDNAANSSGNINIHASMFSLNGGFGAQNYSSRAAAGQIRMLGGVSQNVRRAVSTFSGTSLVSGFRKAYYYDERLMADSPPTFPTTGSYEIISWLE